MTTVKFVDEDIVEEEDGREEEEEYDKGKSAKMATGAMFKSTNSLIGEAVKNWGPEQIETGGSLSLSVCRHCAWMESCGFVLLCRL